MGAGRATLTLTETRRWQLGRGESARADEDGEAFVKEQFPHMVEGGREHGPVHRQGPRGAPAGARLSTRLAKERGD